MSIDITSLIPETIDMVVWNNVYHTYLTDGKYVLKETLSEYLEADSVQIYINDKLFDTIDKRIALRAGDTLHLEYSLYVGE